VLKGPDLSVTAPSLMFVEALDLLFSNLHEAGIDLSTVSAVLQITRCVCAPMC